MMDNQPIISKKKILIALGAMAAVVGIVLLILFFPSPDQDLSGQETQFNFAKEGSKIAEIQELIKYGLSREQYTTVFNKLDKELPELEPEAAYFYLVEESEWLEESAQASAPVATVEAEARAPEDDPTATIFGTQDGTEEARTGNGSAEDVLGFLIRSDRNKTYKVRVNVATAPVTVKIEAE